MAPARIDCILIAQLPASPASLSDLALECAEVLGHYATECSVRFGRAALVIGRGLPVDNAAQTLVERFCNESSQREPLNHSEAFEIHNHKVYAPGGGVDYRINSWVRCKSVVLASVNPTVSSALLSRKSLSHNPLSADGSR